MNPTGPERSVTAERCGGVFRHWRWLVRNLTLNAWRRTALRRRNHIGAGVFIAPDTILAGNNHVGDGARLEGQVVLDRNARVGFSARISRTHLGENSRLDTGVICTGGGPGRGRILIGRESYVGVYNVLDWSDDLLIGDHVHIAGPSTGIWTHSSAPMCLGAFNLRDWDRENRPTMAVTVEDCVFIGGNCTVYPGVTVGKHSIVAPNSAVVRDVEPWTMVGGVPAKLLKRLDPGDQRE